MKFGEFNDFSSDTLDNNETKIIENELRNLLEMQINYVVEKLKKIDLKSLDGDEVVSLSKEIENLTKKLEVNKEDELSLSEDGNLFDDGSENLSDYAENEERLK